MFAAPDWHTIVLVGNCRSGKTAFLERAKGGEYIVDYRPTVGIDCANITFEDRMSKLKIVDTSGDSSKYHGFISPCLAANEHIAILIFVNVHASDYVDQVNFWLKFIKDAHASSRAKVMLVGAMADDAENAGYSSEMRKLALEKGLFYIEYSAKYNMNIESVLRMAVEMKRVESREHNLQDAIAMTPLLPKIEEEQPSDCCCSCCS